MNVLRIVWGGDHASLEGPTLSALFASASGAAIPKRCTLSQKLLHARDDDRCFAALHGTRTGSRVSRFPNVVAKGSVSVAHTKHPLGHLVWRPAS